MEKLEAKAAAGERAIPDDEAALRLAISKKLVSAYKSFKETHPGENKHPGKKVTDNITEQVNNQL